MSSTFVSLSSSSSGNCFLWRSGSICGLIDAGISAKRVEIAMDQFGLKPCDINLIMITHEHSDHIAGLKVLLKRCSPLVLVPESLTGFFASEYPDSSFHGLPAHEGFSFENLTITGFRNHHDAKACYGYRLDTPDFSLGHATDMGKPAVHTRHFLKGTDYLVVESNYDRKMLLTGSYPYYLKRRIASALGHLDNDLTLRLVEEIRHQGLKRVMLAHLSQENNDPKIVSGKFSSRFADLPFTIASRNEITVLF
ncbi:MAG: MBL fold metallo-hydrolase [Candidatus Wallbacteria bacterium]|nr:MBL fold metallo-hydrolase [Candidatus Wallbacteria bacterium]